MNSYKFSLISILVFLSSGCSLLFPTEAGDDLSHFKQEAPKLGSSAPDFELQDVEGNTVSLKDLIGKKPIVLQMGSHSCPVYRYRRFDMNHLHAEFKDEVNFIIVYTIEAHPKGSDSPYADEEWLHFVNEITETYVKQPDSQKERVKLAHDSTKGLEIKYAPVLVDTISNQVWKKYGRAPAAAYVIDQQGKIAVRQAWIDPPALKVALDKLLGRTTDNKVVQNKDSLSETE